MGMVTTNNNKQPGEPSASLLVEHWAKQTKFLWVLPPQESFFLNQWLHLCSLQKMWSTGEQIHNQSLAPQSSALRRGAYRDFHVYPSTLSI